MHHLLHHLLLLLHHLLHHGHLLLGGVGLALSIEEGCLRLDLSSLSVGLGGTRLLVLCRGRLRDGLSDFIHGAQDELVRLAQAFHFFIIRVKIDGL